MPSPTFLDDLTQLMQQPLDYIRSGRISIREAARQSGVPYSTLQANVQIGGSTPSPRTQALLDAWFAGEPSAPLARGVSWATDARAFTPSSLANLQPPPGAEAFRLVTLSGDSPTGYVSTPYDFLGALSPYDQAFELRIDPRAIRRVIWTRRGGLPGAP